PTSAAPSQTLPLAGPSSHPRQASSAPPCFCEVYTRPPPPRSTTIPIRRSTHLFPRTSRKRRSCSSSRARRRTPPAGARHPGTTQRTSCSARLRCADRDHRAHLNRRRVVQHVQRHTRQADLHCVANLARTTIKRGCGDNKHPRDCEHDQGVPLLGGLVTGTSRGPRATTIACVS
ncbi:hypothetical protein B0H10DRAFT_2428031, partial [Mycena sp. CBHHK59/15]